MKKFLRISAWVLLAPLALAVLLYAAGAAVNWRDQPPSAAAERMRSVFETRAAVPDANNAYFYILGFHSAPGVDPFSAGKKVADWIDEVNRDPEKFESPPPLPDYAFDSGYSESMRQLRLSCPGRGPDRDCREAFINAGAEGLSETGLLLLSRYRELLKHPQLREQVPLDLRVPLPAYSQILNAQRFFHVDLLRRVNTLGAAGVREQLHDDLEFWRRVQMSSDILITKMIAVAALRNHFHFGNLVLRALPVREQAAGIPEGWRRELSPDELSMLRVMAGELRFAEHVLWQMDAGVESPMDRLTHIFSRPYYQQQDTLNERAGDYLFLVERFAVPIARMEAVTRELKSQRSESSWSVYNFMGRTLNEISGMESFVNYPMRVATLEGMRRAALLTAELRARGLAAEAVPGALATSEVRSPFDEATFEWSIEEGAVVYHGRERHDQNRHLYYF